MIENNHLGKLIVFYNVCDISKYVCKLVLNCLSHTAVSTYIAWRSPFCVWLGQWYVLWSTGGNDTKNMGLEHWTEITIFS